MTNVETVAAAVLYEGYLLWPYRRSARKNQQRWTFGGVYPRAFSEANPGADPWRMQTQCLVIGPAPRVDVRVRFLQVVERQAAERQADGSLRPVDELRTASGQRHLSWDEAREREVRIADLPLRDLTELYRVPISIAAGSEEEPLPGGALVRSWHTLEGTIEISAAALRPDVWQLSVVIANTAPWHGEDRATTLRRTFVSTHTILTVHDGTFVSLMDPPPNLADLAAGCRNEHTWPVLAGETGDHHTLLSSPIILYDYPRIAPESPGDLFDAGEIDQLLTLNILTLTDDEKAEMRATDPLARRILERSESLSADDLQALHGTIRELSYLDIDVPEPVPGSVVVDGVSVSRGSRVRLRPGPGRDIMDVVLSGKLAVVEAVEQDYDDRIHLAVTIEDDPGRDLGAARMIGHRFFFSPEEVEPLR